MTNQELRALTTQRLDAASNGTRIVLLWAGVTAALSLLTGLLSHMLSTGIAGTGGLSGIGLRSILSTAQQILTTATTVALPFWTLGYQRAMLNMARGQSVSDRTLLSGFLRFGPGLRLMLLEGLILGAAFVFVFYVALLLLCMTPLSDPVYPVLEPVLDSLMADPYSVMDEGLMNSLVEAMVPLALCSLGLCLMVLLPLIYRLRLTRLRLMDDPGCGALVAIGTSLQLTKGNCLKLLKLDLGFWWFYLLELAIAVVSYGDSILPMLGIALPISADAAFWMFYVAALVLQVAFYTAFHNRIACAYALFYDSLLPKPQSSVPEESAE